jgi:chromosome segregation ATPase
MISLVDDTAFIAKEYQDEVVEYKKEITDAIESIDRQIRERYERYKRYHEKLTVEINRLTELMDTMSTDFELAEYNGQLYTKVELAGFLTKMKNDMEEVEEEYEEAEEIYDDWYGEKEDFINDIPDNDSDLYYYTEELEKFVHDWMKDDFYIPTDFPEPTFVSFESMNEHNAYLQLMDHYDIEQLENEVNEEIQGIAYSVVNEGVVMSERQLKEMFYSIFEYYYAI